MVLGVDWMKKYSPLVFDFNDLIVSFQKDGKQVKLNGGQSTTNFKLISGEKIQKLIDKDAKLLGEFYMINFDSEGLETPTELQSLLDNYLMYLLNPQDYHLRETMTIPSLLKLVLNQ